MKFLIGDNKRTNNNCNKSLHTVAVKIVQPPVEKKLFLLQLRNESLCRFPTYLLLKLVTLSVLVFSFRPKSSVVQVLLTEKKEYIEFFTRQNSTTTLIFLYKYRDEED